ncbi:MAG: PEP-CTERM sorting domain-containing protein [bacterium]|nr:PEP-CTERM sorting domain-containing protein [bacterium]
MSKRHVWVLTVVLLAGWAPVQAATIVVDGSASEWGASVADNNASTFNVPVALNLLGTMVEDQDDNAGDGGDLGPNRGGQNYDAEYMAIAHEGSELFMTIVTGQRPDNGFARFAPGDVRIETDLGTYWIEVGGGAGGVAGAAISEGSAGSTYTLNGSGYTTGHDPADALQVAGSIWTNVDVENDPIAPHDPAQFMVNGSSTLVGVADYRYTLDDPQTSEHSVIELSFETSLFAGQTIETVHWSPSCGNDTLNLEINFVPEPTSLALLAIGGLALARRRR